MNLRMAVPMMAALALLGACAKGVAPIGGGDGGSPIGGGGDDGGVYVVPPNPNDIPALTNVHAQVKADNVTVTFDPVDGARDYRIFVVPDGTDGGTPVPTDKTYRCAGDREAPAVPLDGDTSVPSGAMATWVNSSTSGYARTTADATLGYVYAEAGPGRVPVYAMGDPGSDGDNPCYLMRWKESRVKQYVTADADRQLRIAAGWLDYGVAFYAVPSGTAGAVQIYTANQGAPPHNVPLYFAAGPEQAARASLNPTPAFFALSSQAPGTIPLTRVFYTNQCGRNHDELVAGSARFQRAAHQGNVPATSVLWTGIKKPTTLAVEALNSGCPFQGHLSPVSLPPTLGHQAFFTLDQVRAADPNGEVFINGQHDGQPRPQALARTYLQVTPGGPETWDFHESFDTDPGPFTSKTPPSTFETKWFTSPKYDMEFINVDGAQVFGTGIVQNEFWVTYADSASDRNGKFRIAPYQTATMSANSFIHATMEVDTVSTNRRYPQILVSDQPVPLQIYPYNPAPENMVNGTTVIVQLFDNYPSRLDIQVCDHRNWDVNDQCPRYKTDWGTDLANVGGKQPPAPVVGEFNGVDRRVRFDVWVSTSKAYAMLDGIPMACANLAVGPKAGTATVTFGDVLYHSGADMDPPFTFYDFHLAHMHYETRRHFDELGFTSGVPAPAWDETKVPCSSTTQ
jgi:hypothetical protein